MQGYTIPRVSCRLKLEDDGTPIIYREKFTEPETIAARIGRELFRDYCREAVAVIDFDNSLRPINYEIVTQGASNACYIAAGEAFKAALLSNAACIVLLHCHPSGELSPSMEDVDFTRKMIAAGELLGVRVLDHIIIPVGRNEIYSFYREQPKLFAK